MGANRLVMQFHITGNCNLHCKHCYRTEGNVQPLSFEDVIEVLEQFLSLRKRYNHLHGIRFKGHVNLTGGEPFIRSDIDRILLYLGEHQSDLSYGILSNGSFLDEKRMELLRATGVSFVQLSLDGDRAMHDALRAPGDYDRVLSKAEALEKNGIRTYISFTANRENMRFLPHVAAQCRKRGITKLWSDRIVPIGGGEDMKALAIGKGEMRYYLSYLKKAQGSPLVRLFYPKTIVTTNRALQFRGTKGLIYACSAGKSLITVDEFGNILPCRRLPIVCGNIREQTLSQIYFENETFLALREPKVPIDCLACPHAPLCGGGAKCQAYAVLGDWKQRDPGCGQK